MQTKAKNSTDLHILTEKVSMKFYSKLRDSKPKSKSTIEAPSQSRVSGLLSWFGNRSTQSEIQDSSEESKVSIPETKQEEPSKLKFAERISPEHLLIGNELQVDLISIASITTGNFVDTEHLWSLSYDENIHLVNVDNRKHNLLAIVAGSSLYIYKYDFKKISEAPSPFKKIRLDEQPILMQVLKEGNVCVFYQAKMEVYLVSDQVRKKFNKKYEIPPLEEEETEYNIFAVPTAYENVLNVFFEEKKPSRPKVFGLWCIEYEFLASEIRCFPPQKIYEIKSSLKKSLKLVNYSKEVFFMNLGNEILALKKGYVLDSATVNLQNEDSTLIYVGKETLLHVSSGKIDTYSFHLSMLSKPWRIQVKATDSIKMPERMLNEDFFHVLEVLNNDYAFIFQLNPRKNRLRGGEIPYSFYVTRTISRKDKLNQLFPKSTDQNYIIGDPDLLEKCDMAEKMGLSIKEIYLELWNRSNQEKQEDFSLLIATKDYNSIKNEVIRKLKKKAMKFTEIKNIEDSSYLMLEERVFGTSCTEEAAMEYLTSHFLRRKLDMFKDIQLMERYERESETGVEEKEGFKMSIREYQNYKSMEIKEEVLSLVQQFCYEEKKSASRNIRFLLRNFKFVFRIEYYDLLEKIIKTAKGELLTLLMEIPQLLPYSPPEVEHPSHIPGGYYEGVWPDISNREWDESLYVDALVTIDNREIILDNVIKSLAFRRNYLSQHDMVIESREAIIKNFEKLRSAHTFYYFISKIFEHITGEGKQEKLRELVDFLESTYSIIPDKIRHKIFLMHSMYSFFEAKNIIPLSEGRPISFSEFLNYEDYELISHCFDKERSMKGLILKDIKNLFAEVVPKEGDMLFNKALLSYFISPLSSVSDLKYILNRINNEKMEFHTANQDMYEILVEAIERKLKLGSDNDIPIEEVLIYIENIPITSKDPKNNEPIRPLIELKTVEKLSKEAELLKAARIDMTLYDILRKPDEVFTKLVNHAVGTKDLERWGELTPENIRSVEQFAYYKNAELQSLSEEIYDKSNAFMIFFIFLAKLCESTCMIKHVKHLLENVNLVTCYDETTADGLVQYMYKWSLSSNKVIVNNEEYILELLKLVPADSKIAIYISAELEFAKVLSYSDKCVEYPLSEGIIGIKDIKEIMMELPAQFVMEIELEKLHGAVTAMQEILLEEFENEDGDYEFGRVNFVTLHQLYEIVIVKMINSGYLKKALYFIEKILRIEICDPTYNIIYPILYIIHLSVELNELNKNNLIDCVFYYFYHPDKLLAILKHIAETPMNPQGMRFYIEEALQKGKQLHKGYNPDNKVLNEEYLKLINSREEEIKYMEMLKQATRHMQQAREEFKNIKYAAIMAMFCNSPYSLAKYLSCSDDRNVKSIRSFLSYAIHEEVFESYSLLELGRRIFIILLLTDKNEYPIQVPIEQYSDSSLEDDIMEVNIDISLENKGSYEYVMWKSAEAFRKKKISLQAENDKKSRNSQAESFLAKSQRIKDKLKEKQPSNEEAAPNAYPFDDSDNDGEEEVNFNESSNMFRSKKKFHFDASEERRNALTRKEKKGSGMLFMSSRPEAPFKTPTHLSVSIRPYRSSSGAIETEVELKKHASARSSQQQLMISEDLEVSEEYNDELRKSSDFGSSPTISRGAVVGKKSAFKQETDHEYHLEIQGVEGEDSHRLENSVLSAVSNPYAIYVNEVIDPEDNIDESPLLGSNIVDDSTKMEEKKGPAKDEQIVADKEQEIQRQQQADVLREVAYQKELEFTEQLPAKGGSEGGQAIINEQLKPAELEEERPINKEEKSSPAQDASQVSLCKKIAADLFASNDKILKTRGRNFDFSDLEAYKEDGKTLSGVVVEFYRHNCSKDAIDRTLQLIQAIVETFPACGISKDSIDRVKQIKKEHSLLLLDISFVELVKPESLATDMSTNEKVFETLYPGLQPYISTENIFKMEKFFEKVCQSKEFKQRIYWDFTLKIPETIDSELNDRGNILVQIKCGFLPKVSASLMNRDFQQFQENVLGSSCEEEFIEVICSHLVSSNSMGSLDTRQDGIQFLEKLQAVKPSHKVEEALRQLSA